MRFHVFDPLLFVTQIRSRDCQSFDILGVSLQVPCPLDVGMLKDERIPSIWQFKNLLYHPSERCIRQQTMLSWDKWPATSYVTMVACEPHFLHILVCLESLLLEQRRLELQSSFVDGHSVSDMCRGRSGNVPV